MPFTKRLVGAVFIAFLMLLGACQEGVHRIESETERKILMIGDSLFAWHSLTGRNVGRVLDTELGQNVIDRSVTSARFSTGESYESSFGFDIRAQYESTQENTHKPEMEPVDWDILVMNGGGNDLFFECNCHSCDRTLDILISDDGQTGQIPAFLNPIRQSGTKVIYVGYPRNHDLGGPFMRCKDELDILETRIQAMARRDRGIYFIEIQDMFAPGDPTPFAFDYTHPSPESSATIARRIADLIEVLP